MYAASMKFELLSRRGCRAASSLRQQGGRFAVTLAFVFLWSGAVAWLQPCTAQTVFPYYFAGLVDDLNNSCIDCASGATPPQQVVGSETVSNVYRSHNLRSDRGEFNISASVRDYGFGGRNIRGFSPRANWTFDDFRFTCQDGRASVSPRMNLRIKGSSSQGINSPTNVPWSSATSLWVRGMAPGPEVANNDVWYPASFHDPYNSAAFYVSTGMFQGIHADSLDGVFTGNPFTIPTNSAVRMSVGVQLGAGANMGWPGSPGAYPYASIGFDYIGFPQGTPAFDLPAGCTCNSAQANIVNNMWLGTQLAPQTVTVSGVVRAECDGAPLGLVGVTLSDAQGTPVSTTTGPDGGYTFSGVAAGGNGQLTVTAPAGYTFAAPLTVPLASDQTLDVTLGCVTTSVSGRVESGCGEGGLAGVAVSLTAPLGGSLGNTMTGANGSFSFTGLRAALGSAVLAVTPPAGFGSVAPVSLSITSDVSDLVVSLPCVYVAVSGTVTAACAPVSCAAAVALPEGTTVTLVDGSGTPHTTATGAGGTYAFAQVRYSGNPGQISVQVPSGFRLASVTTTQGTGGLALTADAVADFALECILVQVSGTVSACTGHLGNVTVDLLDGRGGFCTTNTDANGAYAFPGIPYSAIANGGEVSISIPLGYEAASPGVAGAALTLDGDRLQDFVLGCLNPTGNPLGMGYWKHQANVYLSGRGHAQESNADMATHFPAVVYQHFYENTLNGIHVLGVTYMMTEAGPRPIDLTTIASTLTVNKGGTTLARAKQQYLTLLLNAASGKLVTTATISVDGATCSQAIQQVAEFINDGNASNDQQAHDIAAAINDAQIVPAGAIALDIEHIPYKTATTILVTQSLGVGPSPSHGATTVRFTLAQSEPVSVRVYSVAGRLVRDLASGTLATGSHSLQWDGRDRMGQPSAAGVYYVQVQLGSKRNVHRLVLLR